MEPIISPWVFYFIDKLEEIKMLPLYVFIFAILINMALLMTSETEEKFEKWFFPKVWIALLSLAFIINFIVPSKETAYKMIIANYVTPNNISIVKEVTEDNIASLIDKIAVTSQALSGREKKEKSK
jgi:hypothetical protein|nr:MAG TPA: hypothetical protein [Caudoviricetes sp.]